MDISPNSKGQNPLLFVDQNVSKRNQSSQPDTQENNPTTPSRILNTYARFDMSDDSTTRHLNTASEQVIRMKGLLHNRTKKIKPRLGLVANYLINRGEALEQKKIWHLPIELARKSTERFLKLLHKKDFRDERLHRSFEQIIQTLAACARNGVEQEVKDILNKPITPQGNCLIHELIITRQLKFLKTMLLHCHSWVDLQKTNQRGQTPWALAKDRLEAEMAYLLCLHNTQHTGHTLKNTLSIREWIRTDLCSNIDSGRWLNSESIKALIDFAQKDKIPRNALLWALKKAPLDDQTLQQLGHIPHLFSLTIADGCDAITNHEAWAGIIRHLLRLYDPNNHLAHQSAVSLRENSPSTACIIESFDSFKNDIGLSLPVDHVAGRTLFFKQTNGTKIALKLSKDYEAQLPQHPLSVEAKANEMIHSVAIKEGLKSLYPKNIKLCKISKLPLSLKILIQTQLNKGFHPFNLRQEEDGIFVHAYEAPPGYDQYIDDPKLTLSDCIHGLKVAAYDYGVLTRLGYYHSAMVDIQHDATREQRPHLWSFESFLTRFRSGAGRIDGGFAGLSAANVRRSGLADLKHLLNYTEVVHRYDPNKLHAQHNLLYDNYEQQQVALFEQLGSGVFALALLAAHCWATRQDEENAQITDLPLASTIHQCFSEFLQGYLKEPRERANKLLDLFGVDCDNIANQLKLFSTKAYVKLVESTSRQPVLGISTKLLGTALPHLRQSRSRAHKQKDRLAQIQALYLNTLQPLPEGYPWVDTSMIKTSTQWKKNHGWTNKKGQHCFGPPQGTLPFQRLIRDLYSLVGLSLMVFYEKYTDTEQSSSVSPQKDKPLVRSQESASQCTVSQAIDDESVELIMRPLDGLKVKINTQERPIGLSNVLKNFIYAPIHVFLVVGRHSQNPQFISAGLVQGRCTLANNQSPSYVTEHDKQVTLSLDQSKKYKVKIKSLPLTATEVLPHSNTVIDADQNQNIRKGGHRYGPKFFGLSHCHTRLSKEIIRPIVLKKNLHETMRSLEEKNYLPQFIFKEELSLPCKKWDRGWKPI